jgi:Response regulator of the LytR/AlgR family
LIIFVTAYESFAVEACGLNVIQYLLKNQVLSRIEELMDELVFRLSYIQDNKIYVITNQRRYIKFQQKDIIYIYKHQKNACFVMMDKREEKERISLQDVFNKLNNQEMLWLDRGVILNLNHVWSVSGTSIKMSGGYEITTNETHITELKKALDVYWENLL